MGSNLGNWELGVECRTWATNERDTERGIKQGEPGTEAGDAGASGGVHQTWAPISEVPSLDSTQSTAVRHKTALVVGLGFVSPS